MADIAEIHDQVLDFLLDWKEKHENQLLFTLRKRPQERLQRGYWFIGNENYLAFSCWTGLDWVNKTQSIYIEITVDGQFFLRFSAKDAPFKSELLSSCAKLLGGFKKSRARGYQGEFWTKDYPNQNYLVNLQSFLEDDKPRIDYFLNRERDSLVDKGIILEKKEFPFNFLNKEEFRVGIERIKHIRETRLYPTPPQVSRIREFFVTTIQMKNVGLFGDSQILLGKRATALIGENGGGKTTILRALALGLVGTGSPLIETDGIKMRTLPKIKAISNDGNLTYEGPGKIVTSYRFDEQDFQNGKSNSIDFRPPETFGAVEFLDHIDENGFGLPVNENDGDGRLPYLVIGYPQTHGSQKGPLDIRTRALEPNAYDILPLIQDIEDQRYGMLLKWISEQSNSGDVGIAKVNQIFELLGKILSRSENEIFQIKLKSAISPEKVIVETALHPEGMWFDLLSTGLKNLLGWLGHLVSRFYEAYSASQTPLHEPAIVLIDEIDNYLHPEVHAKLMPVLLDTFKNTQFIITSHSPVILAGMRNTDTKAYRVTDGEIIPIKHFYGRTIQDLMRENFSLPKRVGPEIQRQLDNLDEALANEHWDQARQLLAELQEALGENDPAVIDAKMELDAQTTYGNL
jgi:energy-coupling factor transporter ATP-binding protein EcfA2